MTRGRRLFPLVRTRPVAATAVTLAHRLPNLQPGRR
jgi:hypothetical protein